MDDKEANEWVTCPACGGKAFSRVGCQWCDSGGVVRRWVALAITTDGIVR
jgi:hypothetical protein